MKLSSFEFPTFFPAVLFHGLDDDDKEQRKEVKPLPHVRARHLEEVVLVELLEHATLELHKLKRHY
jgi:hypothetical protein